MTGGSYSSYIHQDFSGHPVLVLIVLIFIRGLLYAHLTSLQMYPFVATCLGQECSVSPDSYGSVQPLFEDHAFAFLLASKAHNVKGSLRVHKSSIVHLHF